MRPCRDLYREQLIKEGIEEQKLKDIETNANQLMEEAYNKSKSIKFKKEEWLTEEWAKIKDAEKYGDFLNDTGVDEAILKKLGE